MDKAEREHLEAVVTAMRERVEDNVEFQLTQQKLDDLEEYTEAERRRIEDFIEDYERKAAAGSNMDIAIRGQRERLDKLEQRIEDRRRELQRKARVISLAPEVETLCLVLPV